MKILELCNYSAGICGVWNRVKEESERLSKLGHEVKIFSSNLEKGTNKIVSEDDIIGDVLIRRFSARRLGGESFMLWNFEEEALKFKPDVIIDAGKLPPSLGSTLVDARSGKIIILRKGDLESIIKEGK